MNHLICSILFLFGFFSFSFAQNEESYTEMEQTAIRELTIVYDKPNQKFKTYYQNAEYNDYEYE